MASRLHLTTAARSVAICTFALLLPALLLAALLPWSQRDALAQLVAPPVFDEDVALFVPGDAEALVAEGETLEFGVFLGRSAPIDVEVVLEILFGPASNAGAARPADLVDDGTITPSTNGSRFFIGVPIAAGNSSGPVAITTAVDDVPNEGDSGVERFRVRIIEVRGSNGNLTFGPDLELAILDATPAQEPPARPRRPRDRPDLPPPAPTPDPVVGPLAVASIDFSVEQRTVTLAVPAQLRVWLTPNGRVRLLSGDAVLVTTRGTPETISFELPEDAQDPFTVTFQARLRSGAEYNEPVTLTRPAPARSNRPQ